MNKTGFLTLAFLFSVAANAEPATKVAPALDTVPIIEVGTVGNVLKERYQHPFSDYLIAIPAKINAPSACHDFVGIQTTQNKKTTTLQALASTNPLAEACIQIAVLPINTELVYSMRVVTGGIVAADPIQQRIVDIVGSGKFLVELNLDHDSVSVTPVK